MCLNLKKYEKRIILDTIIIFGKIKNKSKKYVGRWGTEQEAGVDLRNASLARMSGHRDAQLATLQQIYLKIKNVNLTLRRGVKMNSTTDVK